MGNFNKKFLFNDLVKGELYLPENDIDIIIMKSSDKTPTYHFAHLVDDYLMCTTHVVRGEDWLSSVPVHVELFSTFGFNAPKYIHTPLIMKKDKDRIRKISKRYDSEASMTYFIEMGYPHLAVIESLLTIINSNYESWRTKNPDAIYTKFEFDPKKMSSSGGFYDLEKLDNLSRNIISKMSAKELFEKLENWSKTYDPVFNALINKHKEYTINVLNIEREQKKPRKDYTNYSSIKNLIWYMFDEYFFDSNSAYEYDDGIEINNVKEILNDYISNFYDEFDDKEQWFNKIKLLCDKLGYASDMKKYKENPNEYRGNVADVASIIRVSLTTKANTPDLYEIMKLLGKERIVKRINSIL